MELQVIPLLNQNLLRFGSLFREGPHFTKKKKKIRVPLALGATQAFDLAPLLASWGFTGS